VRKIVSIVEGDGDAQAVPKIIAKILAHLGRYDLIPGDAKIAGGKSELTKIGGLEVYLDYAEAVANACATLVIIDADDDCPKALAELLANRVRTKGVRNPVAIVVANREYESWFIASLETIKGHRNIASDCAFAGDVEGRRDAKGWLSDQMPRGKVYRETVDQIALTQKIDVALAVQNSRSFRRLVHAVEELVTAADGSAATISP
jgi:hypothetical protein